METEHGSEERQRRKGSQRSAEEQDSPDGITVRGWRIGYDGSGCTMWFDPLNEQPSLRRLTEDEKADMVDRIGSVSALVEGEELCEQQLILFP